MDGLQRVTEHTEVNDRHVLARIDMLCTDLHEQNTDVPAAFRSLFPDLVIPGELGSLRKYENASRVPCQEDIFLK